MNYRIENEGEIEFFGLNDLITGSDAHVLHNIFEYLWALIGASSNLTPDPSHF